MGYRLLKSDEAFWRRSNQMGVLNTDVAKQLEAESLGARFWRIEPGQASTLHRHRRTEELYLLLEGTGRMRVDDQLLELKPMDSIVVEPASLRQLFNDTSRDQLWFVVGAPPELANTVEMSSEDLAWHYPEGPRAMPPELED